MIEFLPIIIVISILGILITNNFSRLPEEKNTTSLYSTYCGGRINWLSYRGPLIRFTIYDRYIIVSAFKKIKIHFEEIEELKISNPPLAIGKSLLIKTNSNKIWLWCKEKERALALIQSRMPKNRRHQNNLEI